MPSKDWRGQCPQEGDANHDEETKRHNAEFEARVALEAVKGLKTSNELAREFQVHPTRISQWKRQLLEMLPEVFRHGKVAPEVAEQELTAPLYEEIGRLKIELDWVKKVLPSSTVGRALDNVFIERLWRSVK